MKVVHLNQKQLAARWCISEATLERWRSAGIGPKFLKLCGRVLYRQADIEAYEESCLQALTQLDVAHANSTEVISHWIDTQPEGALIRSLDLERGRSEEWPGERGIWPGTG